MSRALWFVGGAAAGGVAVYYGLQKLRPFFMAGPAEDALKNAVAVHVRQIRRYAFASSQDLSPIVGLTHASYALVLLDTLEELIGQDAVRKAGYDPKKIRAFITTNQDKHAEKMKACDKHLQDVLKIERADPHGQLPGFVLADPPAQPWRNNPPPAPRRWQPGAIPNVRNGRGLFMGDEGMSAPRGA